MQMSKRTLLTGLAASLASAALPVATFANDLNLSSTGLALRGIDPTSYWREGKPLQGSRAHSVTHAGATYHFTSAQTRIAFLADPDAFLPQYGGFCAYGATVDTKVDGDPYRWNIVGDKLYLNINRPVDLLWKTNKPGYIADADENWPQLKAR